MRRARFDIKPTTSTFLQTYEYSYGVTTLMQDIAYTFDNVGNITDAANTVSAFGTLG